MQKTMASSSEQSYFFPSSSGLSKRPVNASNPHPTVGGPLRPDVDPQPKPRAFLQFLALGLIVFFACLQFLPATHLRDPSDPFRSWIPVDPTQMAATSTNSRAHDAEQSNVILNHDAEVGKIHIFSWMDCLDLRVLAVLANSTISSSRFPERVYFHFFIPEDGEEKLSYYKLKVLFPHSNLDIIVQKEVKEKLIGIPEGDHLWPLLPEIAPLIIPSVNPSLSKFLYVSPDTIIKGSIEDLFEVDLGPYAIAAAEDCSRRLGDYVNIDVLNAIQRTAAKAWVSGKLYDKNACAPDFNVLLLSATRLDKNLMEAILWWRKVLNLGNERSDQINPAIALALYDRYVKLSSAWKRGDAIPSKMDNETKTFRYDGTPKVCSERESQNQESESGNIWQQYLSPKSDAILSHRN